MSHGVWFKFSSEDESTLIAFNGPSIKVTDLKREISTRRNLGSDENFQLRVKDINGREYKDQDAVKKHTYVIVQRVTKTSGPYKRQRQASRHTTEDTPREELGFGNDVFQPKAKVDSGGPLAEDTNEADKRYQLCYFSLCLIVAMNECRLTSFYKLVFESNNFNAHLLIKLLFQYL